VEGFDVEEEDLLHYHEHVSLLTSYEEEIRRTRMSLLERLSPSLKEKLRMRLKFALRMRVNAARKKSRLLARVNKQSAQGTRLCAFLNHVQICRGRSKNSYLLATFCSLQEKSAQALSARALK